MHSHTSPIIKPTFTVSPYCPREAGSCQANGQDQSSGVIELRNGDGNTPASQEECLELCKNLVNVTGCETFGIDRVGGIGGGGGGGGDNTGCYGHTQEVTSGNGEDNRYCWVFSKCETGK